jgi:predicted ArsR family transcriptional regulator
MAILTRHPIYNEERMLDDVDVKLFQVLMQHERGLIRDDLVNFLEKPRTTVFDHIHKWKKYGLIRDYTHTYGRGRPYVFFMLSNKGREFVLRAKKEGYFQ